MTDAENNLSATVAVLADAGDRYRLAITAFNDQAKAELTEYLERKAGQIAAKTLEEQRAVMQEAARHAFRSEASDQAASLGIALGRAAKEFRYSSRARLMERRWAQLVDCGNCGTIFASAHR